MVFIFLAYFTLYNKKLFRSVVFSYSTKQWTISLSDCDVQWKMDCIWQPAMISSGVGPRRSSKALPKVKLTPKEGSWSLFGGLLPIWSTIAFWILAKPLHLRSMFRKSVSCTKNCNTCNRHWSTERARFLPKQCSTACRKPMLQKLNKLRYEVLPHLPYSPTPCQLTKLIFKHFSNFLQGKHFHNQ